MFNVLKQHRIKLTSVLCAASLGLLVFLWAGDLKAISEWAWLDILGEGGSALLALVWLLLVLKSRPAGRVTNYLAAGLGCIFFSWWIDSLDEFIRLPVDISWDHWLESGPMPVGMLLLTLGIYHWHQEQKAISVQMQKREKLFREHRLFDKLTPLGAADYLKRQLQDGLLQARQQQQPLCLIAVDLEGFNNINQTWGHAEGDAVLQALSQLLLLNLRGDDLLCRLAGDRFVVLLANTSEQQARQMALELQQAVLSLAHKARGSGTRLHLSACTAVVCAADESPADLLKRLNQALATSRPVLPRSA